MANIPALFTEDLHDQAWLITEPLFQQKRQEATKLYHELAKADTAKTSNDVREIIVAARNQRVNTLFVPVGRKLWGKFDPKTMTVEIHTEPEPDDEDMLDFAVILTLLNGGTVFAVDHERMPDASIAAAIFRE